MGDVGGHLTAQAFGILQIACHFVKRAGEIADLIFAIDVHAMREITARDDRCGMSELAHRAHETVSKQPAEDERG